MTKDETDVLFEYTAQLVKNKPPLLLEPPKDKTYAWCRKRDRRTSRVPAAAILDHNTKRQNEQNEAGELSSAEDIAADVGMQSPSSADVPAQIQPDSVFTLHSGRPQELEMADYGPLRNIPNYNPLASQYRVANNVDVPDLADVDELLKRWTLIEV